MFLGEVFAHDPHVERRRAPLAHLFGVGQHGAIFFQLVHGWGPDIGSVNIPTLPGRDYRGWLEIKNLNLPRLDAPVFERRQQAVVGGRDKRHGDALADQVFRFGDVFLHHQRFRVTELRGEQEHLNRHLLAGRDRQRAGSDIADLHVAGG